MRYPHILEIWDAMRQPAGRGMHGLREEVIAAANPGAAEDAASGYDQLVSQDDIRAEAVKVVQRYFKRLASYTRTIDGDWGRYSEDSYLRLVPSARGYPTRLIDLVTVARGSAGQVTIGQMVAAGISRDEYLRSDRVDRAQALRDDDPAPEDGWGTWDEAGTSSEPETPAPTEVGTRPTATVRAYRSPTERSLLPFASSAGGESELDDAEGDWGWDEGTTPAAPYTPPPASSGTGTGMKVAVVAAVVLVLGTAAVILIRRSRRPATAGLSRRTRRYR